MKIAILLCTLFAVSLAAVRPEFYGQKSIDRPELYRKENRPELYREEIRPELYKEESQKIRFNPKRLSIPAQSDSESGYPWKNNDDRIISGSDATKGAYPYQISLQRGIKFPFTNFIIGWSHTCGGSIIDPTTILTAAHCVDSGDASSFRVDAGEYNFDTDEGTEQKITVSRLTIHQGWTPSNFKDDIALVHLSRALTFNSDVSAVTLSTNNPTAGTETIVTGWGYIDNSQTSPSILQQLLTTIASDADGRRDAQNYYDPPTQVPIYVKGVENGVCNGDSGGPLVDSNSKEQYGIVSYGITPCGKDRCDYFTRVYAYNSWITNNS